MTAPGGMPASSRTDRTTLFGVLGIIFALCCGLLGLVFGILSITQARNNNRPQTMGWIAVVIAVVNLVAGVVVTATGHYPQM